MTVLLRTDNESASTPDDAELMRRVADRDRAAFGLLYDRLAGVLYTASLRILNDSAEAEDVIQDLFVQIWDKAVSYDQRLGKPFNWALTMTRNRSIDRLRALKRRYEFIAEATDTAHATPVFASDAGHEVYQREKTTHVRRALTELPLEQRQALEMAFLGGMTQNEIADRLGQPLGTIKARIRRGMLKLKESLGGWL